MSALAKDWVDFADELDERFFGVGPTFRVANTTTMGREYTGDNLVATSSQTSQLSTKHRCNLGRDANIAVDKVISVGPE